MSAIDPPRPDAFALVTDSLVEGWRRMVFLMFRGPSARVGKWFAWGMIILMAGLLGGGGPGNFVSRQDASSYGRSMPEFDASLWLVLGAVVLLIIILVVVLFYFQARFRLVFIESVIAGEPRIRGVFRRTAAPGLSYFVFRLVTAFVGVVLIGAAILAWAGSLIALVMHGDDLGPGQVLGLVLTVLLWILPVALALAILNWFVHHLALPHLWLKHEGFGAACRTAWRLTREHFGATLLFLVMQVLVRIAAAVVALVALCATCCIWCWPALLIVLLAVATAAAPIALIVTAPLIVALGFLMAWLFATALAPIPVFFRAWSLAFVAGVDPGLSLTSATAAPPTPPVDFAPEIPPLGPTFEPPPPEAPPAEPHDGQPADPSEPPPTTDGDSFR